MNIRRDEVEALIARLRDYARMLAGGNWEATIQADAATALTALLARLSEADRLVDNSGAALYTTQGELERCEARLSEVEDEKRVAIRAALAESIQHSNDEIRRQFARAATAEARLSEVEKALEPFKKMADAFHPNDGDELVVHSWFTNKEEYLISLGDLRRARSALHKDQQG